MGNHYIIVRGWGGRYADRRERLKRLMDRWIFGLSCSALFMAAICAVQTVEYNHLVAQTEALQQQAAAERQDERGHGVPCRPVKQQEQHHASQAPDR